MVKRRTTSRIVRTKVRAWGHQTINRRPSRRFFIDGQSPQLLACTSRRASTICQPREFRYLQPVNGLRNFPWSAVPQPYPRLTGAWCIPLFSLHSFQLYPHSVLCARTPYFYTCTSIPGISRISSDCSFLSSIPWNWTRILLADFPTAYVHGLRWLLLLQSWPFSTCTAFVKFLRIPAVLSVKHFPAIFRCMGAYTMWYLQFQLVCDKLFMSFM